MPQTRTPAAGAGPLHRGGACCRILAHAREHDGERTWAVAVGDRLEQQIERLVEEVWFLTPKGVNQR